MTRLSNSPATSSVSARAYFYGYFYGFRYAG
jgi:hypothetical protein